MKELIEELRRAADVKPADCPELFEKAADAIESQAETIAHYKTTTENCDLLRANVDEQAREIERLKREAKNDAIAYKAAIERQEELRAELAALKSQPSGVVLPERFEMEPYQTVDKGSSNYKAGFNAAIKQIRESLNQQPVSAGDDALTCDYCGAETEDPWHGSGMMDGAESRHIHACDGCRHMLPSVSAGGVDERAALATIERFVDTVRECYHLASSYSGCLDNVDEHGGDDHEDPICAVFHRLYYAMFDGDKALEQARAALTASAPNHSELARHMVREGWQLVPVELLEQWANDLALQGVGDIETAQQIDALLEVKE